jgi:hypothetical protein
MPYSVGRSRSIAAAIALTAISAFGLGGTITAWAETVSIDKPAPFETDLADLLPGARPQLSGIADKVRNSECPGKLEVEVVVRKGPDPLFDETVAKARKEALDAYFVLPPPQGLGLKADQFTIKLFKGAKDEVKVSYRSDGKAPPNLHTDSDPPKGHRVQPGDKIMVTITARDEANPAQSGIEGFFLNGPNGLHDAWFLPDESKCTTAARRPKPYKAKPYIVPDNPPPIVRLEAKAVDFAGNPSEVKEGTFPTGDWYGTMKLQREIVNEGYQHTITWTFAVSEVSIERQDRDPRGKIIYTEARVRGRSVGQIVYTPTSKHEECTSQHNIRPAQFKMEVTGKRQDDRLIIDFPDPGVIDTVRERCVRGYDETEPRPFHDTQRNSFDMSDIKDGARTVVPPIDQNNRVTTTMELYRAKQ